MRSSTSGRRISRANSVSRRGLETRLSPICAEPLERGDCAGTYCRLSFPVPCTAYDKPERIIVPLSFRRRHLSGTAGRGGSLDQSQCRFYVFSDSLAETANTSTRLHQLFGMMTFHRWRSQRHHFDTGNQTLYRSADGTQPSALAVATVQAGLLYSHDLLVV
jgi:hypothetical protein